VFLGQYICISHGYGVLGIWPLILRGAFVISLEAIGSWG
jgi:hypothetical protein